MYTSSKSFLQILYLLSLVPRPTRKEEVVSQASPIPFRSADRFQYRHAEEGSGDLGPLYVNSWNAIIG